MGDIQLFDIGFLTITVTDLIDIAIVAVALYKLYSLIRGTIASQIFIGLLFILTISYVSQTFDMKLLSWMLRTVSDIWVIALIILFQPELRRILQIVGRRGWLTGVDRYDVNRVVDELVETAEELAVRRFGALIVIPRSTDIYLTLDDSGVPVEAKLSKEMLLSIFNPRSPLHDGAVILAGEMIQSARIILPLSPVTQSHGVMLGTRHRAGLGISEQMDVFVVIVSEERGSISYALNGKLYRDQTTDALRLALLKTLEAHADDAGGKSFWNIVRNVFRGRRRDGSHGHGGRSKGIQATRRTSD